MLLLYEELSRQFCRGFFMHRKETKSMHVYAIFLQFMISTNHLKGLMKLMRRTSSSIKPLKMLRTVK
jgi:hypothetical protein